MNDTRNIPVYGRNGKLGWVEPRATAGNDTDIIVRLENGTTIRVPQNLLTRQEDGSYYLPISQDQLQNQQQEQPDAQLSIPVIVEEPVVSKKRTTRTVRINKTVHEREEVIDQPGFNEEVEIERVPINRVVDKAPEVHYEGDTMIIPVMEEVLVVEKQLVLKEEVRVTRRRETVHKPQKVSLRAEEVQVERLDPEEDRT